MKPKLFIIIGIVLLSIIILVVVLLSRMTQPSQQPTQSQTPAVSLSITPIETGDYEIVSSTPANQETNVSTSLSTLKMDFNKALPADGITISFYPPVQVSQVVNENTLTIALGTTLQPGTTYSYTVAFGENVITRSFTVAGPTPTVLPDTRPEGFFEEIQEENKVNRPDIYLANLVPYTEASFYIESVFKPNPDRYGFVVTLLGSDQAAARTAVQQWLLQQGLTQTQINALDITYE